MKQYIAIRNHTYNTSDGKKTNTFWIVKINQKTYRYNKNHKDNYLNIEKTPNPKIIKEKDLQIFTEKVNKINQHLKDKSTKWDPYFPWRIVEYTNELQQELKK